jgi:hypothetical protein
MALVFGQATMRFVCLRFKANFTVPTAYEDRIHRERQVEDRSRERVVIYSPKSDKGGPKGIRIHQTLQDSIDKDKGGER